MYELNYDFNEYDEDYTDFWEYDDYIENLISQYGDIQDGTYEEYAEF